MPHSVFPFFCHWAIVKTVLMNMREQTSFEDLVFSYSEPQLVNCIILFLFYYLHISCKMTCFVAAKEISHACV